MECTNMRQWCLTFLCLLSAIGTLAVPAFLTGAEPAEDLSQYFGFAELEVFKLRPRSGSLLAADVNQDGRSDLLIVDNSSSRIDILQQRAGALPAGPAPRDKDVNSLADDVRFERRKIAVNRAVSALAVGDFNGDGRADLAYLGQPDRLTVRVQGANGEWAATGQEWRLPDLQPAPAILAAGDLNGDKLDDLVLLGKNETYVLTQRDGSLAAPETLMNTSDKLALAHIGDLDGDGRNDLCYLTNDEGARSLCSRLQTPQGRLGPELRFDLGRPRAVTIRDVDGRPGLEIITVDAQTGRVKLLQWERPQTRPDEFAAQLIQYGFGQQGVGRDRDLAIGDITGDGLADVVVTDPELAQMIVFRQLAGAGLDQGSTFPGLLGTTQVRLGDLDGDKIAEVVVHSPKEKTIGVSRIEGGRLTFPQPIPLEKEPAALELADLNSDGRPELLYISKERTGSTTNYALRAVQRVVREDNEVEWKPYLFAGQLELPLKLRGDPERLTVLDANADGRPDFLVFLGQDRPPLFLRSDPNGLLTEVSSEGRIGLGNVSAGNVFFGDLDGPAVLVAQNNFARKMQLGDNQQWQVVDQYNASESSAKIGGAAAIDLDGKPGAEIVLIDQGVNKLRVLRREQNLYRPWREVDIGTFPYKSVHVADLNGDSRNDLLLFGGGKFGVLFAGQSDLRLKELASFETKLENVRFSDAVAGDLNGDGRVDIALIDTQSQFIEVLDYHPQLGLRHALNFRVFESKSLAGGDESGTEPRESLIADVTGDGRADIVLLCHDRVLLYPQDAGQQP